MYAKQNRETRVDQSFIKKLESWLVLYHGVMDVLIQNGQVVRSLFVLSFKHTLSTCTN